ncbi:uncharacterized protein [Haliotis cracherodii]|uniref:uncharacterized protein n=1 Tax=Haliotis cracherodii TaxID=6455 RepID=UPI0039E92430
MIASTFSESMHSTISPTPEEERLRNEYMKQGVRQRSRRRGRQASSTRHGGQTTHTVREPDTVSTATTSYTYSVEGKGVVKLYTGDIVKASVHALVTWEDSQIKPCTSASAAITKATGDIKLDHRLKDLLCVSCSHAGNMNDKKHIIHAIVPVHSLSLADLQELLKRVLKTSDGNGDSAALTPLTTGKDAIDTGWGAHVYNLKIQGLRNASKEELHINCPEIEANIYALQIWYIQKQGGTKSSSLMNKTTRLFVLPDWWMDVRHLSGNLNIPADSLSRGGRMLTTNVNLEGFAKTFCNVTTETMKELKLPEIHMIDKNPKVIASLKKIFDSCLTLESQEETMDIDVAGATGGEKECSICKDTCTDPKMLKCGHRFCSGCIDYYFNNYKSVCPNCGAIYGPVSGTMPEGEMRVSVNDYNPLKGHPYDGTICITYNIPNGIQTEEHPNPGKPYIGASWTCYLPDSAEGRKVLRLLKVAFDRRLTFTVGRSVTTGVENKVTWNDIHHKTSYFGNFGYPDPDYLERVQEELAAKGVTEADIDWITPV